MAHIAKADELLMLVSVVALMWNAKSLTGLWIHLLRYTFSDTYSFRCKQ